MHYEIVLITPELAAQWLERNTRNRPVSRAHVERLVRDLKGNRWVLNHQGIAFGRNGVLLDGQHRLMAIAESGKAAMCVVWHGVDDDAVRGMDQGKDRNGRDVMALAGGEPISVREAACINAMVRGMSPSALTFTAQEQAAAYAQHLAAARFALALLPDRKVGLTRAPVAAVVARASYTVDHELLRKFCEILLSGIVRSDPDATVIQLRDFLLRTAGSGASQLETYRKVVRALDIYRKGERVVRLHVAKGDPFPLPEVAPVEATNAAALRVMSAVG